MKSDSVNRWLTRICKSKNCLENYLIAAPPAKTIWKNVREEFSENFRKEIDKIISEY